MILHKHLVFPLIASVLFLSSCGEIAVKGVDSIDKITETTESTPNAENSTESKTDASTETPTNNTKLTDGEFGYSMDVDGKNISNNKVLPLDGFDRQVASFLTLGDTPNLQLRMIPEDAPPASYSCGEGAAFRKIALSYGGYVSDNEAFPGTCNIKLTSAGKVYEGTFSGTLYNASGEKINITNGFFRNDGSTLK